MTHKEIENELGWWGDIIRETQIDMRMLGNIIQ